MPNETDGKLRRTFGRPLGKRTRIALIVLVSLLSLFVAFQLAAPFLVSTVLVRERMERAVEEWIGHDVSIGGQPSLAFWPEPRITFSDVMVRNIDHGKKGMLGSVRELSASFDLLGALVGQPEFKDFHLKDPQLFVLRKPDGRLDWTNDGLLSRAVRAVKSDGTGQLLDNSNDAPIGDVLIENGTLQITNEEDGRIVRVDRIDSEIDWSYLSRSASFKGQATIAGRRVTADITSRQPLLLFSGRSSSTSGSIQSDLFNAKFSGVVNLASHGFLSGDAEFATADGAKAMQWMGFDLPGTEKLKQLSVKARLITNDTAMRFESLSLGIDDITASGILDLTMPADAPPRLTGTLALNTRDVLPMLAEIAPRLLDKSDPAARLRDRLELDLRLSAQSVEIGPFQLSEVAVGIMNIGDQSRIDILDSDFENGRLTGRIATIKDEETGGVAIRLSVQDADFASVISRLGLTAPLPGASGSLELALDVARPVTAETLRNAKGSLRFRAGSGTLPGVDMAGIRRLATQKPYFTLSEAGTGAYEFQSVDINVTVADGLADIRNGLIVGTNERITLNGIVPYANNSLALSAGVLTDSSGTTSGDAAAGRPDATHFFIGGSWQNPVIWPVAKPTPKITE
ncbi:AsmA family protein [Neorhizobium sp. AL 9.2.2]|uniref:AsmA family protein n=1 Tax=Neorhizobium sp. AL 9.2.2 TaxID=2712894 RepID=UPI00157437AB|nr:AsmA-like C-terminal region-containing protein [Neorhizobium sp. AL 9.2.2]NSY16269.1 AsmA family protein [Neorhizobium sp. AL 9.2.2]